MIWTVNIFFYWEEKRADYNRELLKFIYCQGIHSELDFSRVLTVNIFTGARSRGIDHEIACT